MTDPLTSGTNATTPVDPYAGARAMGIPAPPAPEATPETVEAAQVTYTKNADGTYSPVGHAEAAAEAVEAAPADVVTGVGDAESAFSAVAPGVASRLRALISSHQDLITTANEILAEVEKF